jgi:hypothetical protein
MKWTIAVLLFIYLGIAIAKGIERKIWEKFVGKNCKRFKCFKSE